MPYSPPGLSFVEIADQSLAAGTSITPTVSGIFSAYIAAPNLRIRFYLDSAGVWYTVPAFNDTGISATGAERAAHSIVGEANKISFTNTSTSAIRILVNRIG